MAGPLDGIKILDLSSVVLGPLTTQILGDLGADVIKLEGPAGDPIRYTGPARSRDMAALFLAINRNKRSIVLDLKKESARDAVWRLIDGTDVFIHSIRPQAVDRLGFGHEAVIARNPRIIYAGIHGYRSGGPYEGQPAYDDVIQGQSGVADMMARQTGEPRYFPTIMADKTCAQVAAYAIMAALFARERSGKGQFVEIPMFETMVAFNMVDHLFGHSFSPPEGDIGYSRVLAPYRRPYKTKDGHIGMLAYTDAHWLKFWDAVGKPELKDDTRFASLKSRSDNVAELYRIAGESLMDKTTDEWVAIFGKLEVPAARITRLDELEDDPQLLSSGFFQHRTHPTEGDLVMPDFPVRFSETPADIRRLQPKLGEHTREILRESGLAESEIEAMIAEDAAVDRDDG
jgi:crotonobetainyl-CoA:carnitine CoA-transferase CaiB-like acyl-CoA transferase